MEDCLYNRTKLILLVVFLVIILLRNVVSVGKFQFNMGMKIFIPCLVSLQC